MKTRRPEKSVAASTKENSQQQDGAVAGRSSLPLSSLFAQEMTNEEFAEAIRQLQIKDRKARIRECHRLARQCQDEEARQRWLELARDWKLDLHELRTKRPPFTYSKRRTAKPSTGVHQVCQLFAQADESGFRPSTHVSLVRETQTTARRNALTEWLREFNAAWKALRAMNPFTEEELKVYQVLETKLIALIEQQPGFALLRLKLLDDTGK